MKLKHKKLGVELEVEVDKHTDLPNFYITSGGSLIHRNDHDWELVKEEEWEDVTREFHVDHYLDPSNERMFSLSDSRSGKNAMHAYNGYRVRKIDGPHSGPCFIVERRTP